MAIEFRCDMCGQHLAGDDLDRFIVRVEVFASAEHLSVDTRGPEDPEAAFRKLVNELRRADPNEIEDQTYRQFRFDLCRRCQKLYLRQPLPSAGPR